MIQFNRVVGGLIPLVVVVFSKLTSPSMIFNESVYLLQSKILAGMQGLEHDWTWQNPYSGFGLPFSLLILPLQMLFRTDFHVALLARLGLWMGVFFSLDSFLRSMGLSTIARVTGVILWLLCGQALVAGEWIVGGAEQKVVAYILFFMALSTMLRGHTCRTIVLLGVASIFHVAVGFWGSLAVGGTLVLGHRTARPCPSLRRLGLACLAYIPALALMSRSLVSGSQSPLRVSPDVTQLLVTFRNPHHLDPAFFLSLFSVVGIAVMFAATYFCFARSLEDSHRSFARYLLVVLLAQFILGLVARALGAYSLLLLYPFRVFDTMAILLFFTLGCGWIERQSRELHLKTGPRLRWRALRLVAGVALLASVCVHKARWEVTAIPPFLSASSRDAHSELVELGSWAQDSTETSDVFVVDPFDSRFWLLVERPMVVAWKIAPASPGRFAEWYSRILALNGEEQPQSSGFDFREEMRRNFSRLNNQQLGNIRHEYSGRFYVVRVPRPDLGIEPRYRSDSYFVYDLKEL